MSDSCKCRPICVKSTHKIEANVVVSEFTAQLLIKFYVITLLHFLPRCFNIKNVPL